MGACIGWLIHLYRFDSEYYFGSSLYANIVRGVEHGSREWLAMDPERHQLGTLLSRPWMGASLGVNTLIYEKTVEFFCMIYSVREDRTAQA